MKIAIRKEPSGLIYISKTALNKFDIETLKQPPYNFSFTEVEDEYFDDIRASDFNDDLTFSYDKYNFRKKQERLINYECLVVSKIRLKYTLDQEIALLRQRDLKYAEFVEYNEYVEKCKAEAKKEVGYGI